MCVDKITTDETEISAQKIVFDGDYIKEIAGESGRDISLTPAQEEEVLDVMVELFDVNGVFDTIKRQALEAIDMVTAGK